MRILLAIAAASLLAGAGGCTFEHHDYGGRHRHAEGYYRTQRVRRTTAIIRVTAVIPTGTITTAAITTVASRQGGASGGAATPEA